MRSTIPHPHQCFAVRRDDGATVTIPSQFFYSSFSSLYTTTTYRFYNVCTIYSTSRSILFCNTNNTTGQVLLWLCHPFSSFSSSRAAAAATTQHALHALVHALMHALMHAVVPVIHPSLLLHPLSPLLLPILRPFAKLASRNIHLNNSNLKNGRNSCYECPNHPCWRNACWCTTQGTMMD